MAKRLVISFVGRTCLVTKEENAWVLFLNAEHNPALKLRRHQALLSVPLSMIGSADTPEKAFLTTATRVRPLNRGVLVDSLGVWDIANYDMFFEGIVSGGRGARDTENLANLNALAGPPERFEDGVIGDNVERFPVVLSRVRLPTSSNIVAVTEDLTVKTFLPGGYRQVIATYIRVTATFANDLVDPALCLKKLKSDVVQRYKFNGIDYDDVEVTMTNLCNCAKHAGRVVDGNVLDDEEFGLYYELMRSPLPLGERPLPHVPQRAGAVHIPQCYNAARLAF